MPKFEDREAVERMIKTEKGTFEAEGVGSLLTRGGQYEYQRVHYGKLSVTVIEVGERNIWLKNDESVQNRVGTETWVKSGPIQELKGKGASKVCAGWARRSVQGTGIRGRGSRLPAVKMCNIVNNEH